MGRGMVWEFSALSLTGSVTPKPFYFLSFQFFIEEIKRLCQKISSDLICIDFLELP